MRNLRKGSKILVCLLLCVACLLCDIAPATAASDAKTPTQTLTSLVRFTAEKDGTPVGQLKDGTVITVVETKGSFYKIDCYGMTAYIAKSQVAKEGKKYYVNCVPDSSETCTLKYKDSKDAKKMREDMFADAKEQLGTPYVYGGKAPGGFDCSGFSSWLYKQIGIKLNRRASLQMQNGVVISKSELQVGDLVFFRQGTSNPASHVGIYAGDNQMIHAGSKTGIAFVSLSKEYYEKYYVGARRVINTATDEEQEMVEVPEKPQQTEKPQEKPQQTEKPQEKPQQTEKPQEKPQQTNKKPQQTNKKPQKANKQKQKTAKDLGLTPKIVDTPLEVNSISGRSIP